MTVFVALFLRPRLHPTGGGPKAADSTAPTGAKQPGNCFRHSLELCQSPERGTGRGQAAQPYGGRKNLQPRRFQVLRGKAARMPRTGQRKPSGTDRSPPGLSGVRDPPALRLRQPLPRDRRPRLGALRPVFASRLLTLPPRGPDSGGRARTATGPTYRKTRCFQRVLGLVRFLLDRKLVEAGGIEPPSESTLQKPLHA